MRYTPSLNRMFRLSFMLHEQKWHSPQQIQCCVGHNLNPLLSSEMKHADAQLCVQQGVACRGIGQLLSRQWPVTVPAVASYCPGSGQLLSRQWPVTVPAVAIYCRGSGHLLSRQWPVTVPAVASYCLDSGHLLSRQWPVTVPAVASYCPGLFVAATFQDHLEWGVKLFVYL
jgi:hypothetical protein